MPKEWSQHKAEVERLYMREGKSLEEVRAILKTRHGFIASIRAYRMKIDEWGLRKYKPRKDRSCPQSQAERTPSPTSVSSATSEPLSFPNPQNQDLLIFGFDISIPTGNMIASDVLALVTGPSATFYALEVLLMKWQPGGEYLDVVSTLLENGDYCKWITRCASNGRPLLFTLIEERVPQDEQFAVGKILLGAHFRTRYVPESPDVQWLAAWNAARTCTEWEIAQERLFENSIISDQAGAVFLDCALVVIAEQLLRRSIMMFRALRRQTSSRHLPDTDDEQQIRQNILAILADVDSQNLELRPVLYKYSLDIIETTESANGNKETLYSKLADQFRHKYLQLTSLSSAEKLCDASFEDSLREIEESEWIEKSGSSTPSNSSISALSTEGTCQSLRPEPDQRPPASLIKTSLNTTPAELPTETLSSQNVNISEACKAVHDLMRKWKALKGFPTHVQDILAKDGSGVSVFHKSASPRCENIFDVIYQQIPKKERISLTKATLTAFSTVNIDLFWRPWGLKWWRSIYTSSTWESLQSQLSPSNIDEHLSGVMSSEAIQLFLNATIFLVGERMLYNLKDDMVANPHDLRRYHKNYREYMAILQELRKRGLNLDPAWLSCALNMV